MPSPYDSVQAEVVNAIYDTLVDNECYPKIKPKNISDGFVDPTTGEIELLYTIDTIYTEPGIKKRIKPQHVDIKIQVDVFTEP